MSSVREQFSVMVDALWRHRRPALAAAWVTGLVGAIAIWFIPERHEVSTKIYVDTQSVLRPLMSGLAFQPDQEQQVRMLAKTLISRPNIERIVNDPALGFDLSNAAATDQLIERLTQRIQMRPLGGGNIYGLSLRDAEADRSLAIVEQLLKTFVREGTDNKRRDSKDASKFIESQIKSYEAKLNESEGRLKDFKLRNFGLSGTSQQDHFARISALSEGVSKLRIDLSAATNARDALARELSKEDPQLPREAMNVGGQAQLAPTEISLRLDAQRRQLDELRRRFTDEHPDVAAALRTIRELEAARSVERARVESSLPPAGRAPTNPVYQSLRVSLAKAESDVATLRTQLAAQQSSLDTLRETAAKVPQVEAELAQLNRDYEVIRKNYDQLVARRESARMGERLDESTADSEFRVVEPPAISPQPVFPSRKVMAAGVVFFSLLASFAVAYALSITHPVVGRVSELKALAPRPVLGSISGALTPAIQASQRQEARLIQIGGALLLLALLSNVVMTVVFPYLKT